MGEEARPLSAPCHHPPPLRRRRLATGGLRRAACDGRRGSTGYRAARFRRSRRRRRLPGLPWTRQLPCRAGRCPAGPATAARVTEAGRAVRAGAAVGPVERPPPAARIGLPLARGPLPELSLRRRAVPNLEHDHSCATRACSPESRHGVTVTGLRPLPPSKKVAAAMEPGFGCAAAAYKCRWRGAGRRQGCLDSIEMPVPRPFQGAAARAGPQVVSAGAATSGPGSTRTPSPARRLRRPGECHSNSESLS